MATQTDEIIVRFKTEGGQDVEEHFKRIGDEGDHASRRIKRTGDEVEGLRAKSEGRVAHNIGRIAQSMTSGADAADIFAESVTSLSESFRGSLIFAGAALGGFAIYKGITKASEAAIALDEQIHKITTQRGPASFQPVDSIKQRITDAEGSLTKLYETASREGRRGGVGGNMRGFINQMGRFAAGQGVPGEQNLNEAKQVVELRNALVDSTKDLAKKTLEVVAVERIRRDYGSYLGDLAKEELRHREAIGEATRIASFDQAQGNDLAHAENALNKENVATLRTENQLRRFSIIHQADSARLARADTDDTTRQITLLQREVDFRRQLVNLARGTKEKDEAQSDAEQAQTALENFKRVTLFNRKLEFDQTKATTSAIEEQARGHERIARTLEIEAAFEGRIARARFEGKNYLIPQLRRQEAATLFNQNLDEILKSPGQQAAEARREQREQLRRDRALSILNDRGDREANGAFGQSDAGTEHGQILKQILSVMRQSWN